VGVAASGPACPSSQEQLANSIDLNKALVDAIIDAFEAHQGMSSQALGSAKVQMGLKDIHLGPTQFSEELRARSIRGSAAPAAGQ
jgi:type I restriction enzyme R subunit